jgi:uncharacterized protein with FMN-binding domain
MRRITYWALSTVSAVVLLFSYHTSTSGAATIAGSTTGSTYSASLATTSGGSGSGSGGDDTDTGTPGATGGATASSSPSSGSTAPTARKVTGSVAQTQWGPVQVRLTISSAKITNVDVVQYPNGNGTDQEINSYALPILTQETIDAQGAGIDMVSGATVTSNGYLESLQSALDRAGL